MDKMYSYLRDGHSRGAVASIGMIEGFSAGEGGG